MKKIYKKEEYIYKHLPLRMSTKQMANVLYAGIMTDSEFTTLWTLSGKEYDRKQNSYNGAWVVVHIHPDLIERFEELSELKLQAPHSLTIN